MIEQRLAEWTLIVLALIAILFKVWALILILIPGNPHQHNNYAEEGTVQNKVLKTCLIVVSVFIVGLMLWLALPLMT